MRKCIVTTTINSPTEATIKFCEIADKKGWVFIIVGDKKTPHEEYEYLAAEHKNVIYMPPEDQEKHYKELSDSIGWNSIQRRNIGFVAAYNTGTDIVATVDDDNIPYENWGDDLLIGKEIEVDTYQSLDTCIFDPISVTNHSELWHRGFPIDEVPFKNNISYKGKTKRKILVQADFWDGDPDIDAICRLSKMPTVKFDKFDPFCSNQMSPFNSQNTFIAREVLPNYAVLPHVGRMDDIWGGYILQVHHPNCIAYNKATVYQDRNIQNLVTNLKNEIIGYENTWKLVNNLEDYRDFLPEATLKFWDIYQKSFK